jgi:hypothetical protein
MAKNAREIALDEINEYKRLADEVRHSTWPNSMELANHYALQGILCALVYMINHNTAQTP